MTLALTLLPSVYCFVAASYNNPNALLHSRMRRIWNAFQDPGGTIRNKFFLPLAKTPLPERLQKNLEKDQECYRSFWDHNEPLNPLLSSHAAIRETFTQRQESIEITVNGKLLEVGYTVIESRSLLDHTQNLVVLLGNLSTLDNTIMYQYPFLEFYAKKVKEDPYIASFRMICISQYATKLDGNRYMAETIDESGQILTEILKVITKEKGPIAQVVANSIGSIILAASLKFAKKEGALPLNLCFDRGLASVKHRSKLYGIFGRCLLPLLRVYGWYISSGRLINEHLSTRLNQSVDIVEVVADHIFPGRCSLVKSRHLEKQIPGMKKFSFDFPNQVHTNVGHHFLHTGTLSGHYLVPRNDQLLANDETIADMIMKRMFV